jgi:hypothetical protein
MVCKNWGCGELFEYTDDTMSSKVKKKKKEIIFFLSFLKFIFINISLKIIISF